MFCHQEEKLKGKPGYEHLNEQLHILIEADLPADIVDIKLRQAQEIIEELVKPVVCALTHFFSIIIFRGHKILNGLRSLCRMSHRTTSRGSNYESSHCWTQTWEKTVQVQAVASLHSIQTQWNVQKQDAKSARGTIIKHVYMCITKPNGVLFM